MVLDDELLDRLGDVYLKYPFRLPFGLFVEQMLVSLERDGALRVTPQMFADGGCPRDGYDCD